MKKLLSSILIILILFNFIVCSISHAESTGAAGGGASQTMQDKTGDGQVSSDAAMGIAEEGTGKNPGGQKTTFNPVLSIVGAVLGYISVILDIIPITINVLMILMTNESTANGVFSGTNHVVGTGDEVFFTIERVIFNRLPLVNINYFDTNSTYKIGTGDAETLLGASPSNTVIKNSVTKWFVLCRLLALIIGLLVLIYIGIRMAISTVAGDKATYKKMLVGWVESVIVLFLLHYILIVIINIGEVFLNICVNLRYIIMERGGKSFETIIMDTIYMDLFRYSGFKILQYSIIFWFLVFIQLKFFFTYFKRFLMVGFLIAIAPLITITYSIDKIGDGRAQAFSLWFREMLINIFIQPIHAIIYLVFIFTAGAIAEAAPFIGLVFLLALGSAEKMIKSVFSLNDAISIRSLDNWMKKE